MSTVSKLKTVVAKTPIVRTLYEGFMKRAFGSYETYHDNYVEFVAKRRGLSADRAGALVVSAEKQFRGGWIGDDYRKVTEQLLETFRPLYDDVTDRELLETYRFHGPFDFLRMLGYVIPKPKEIEPIVSRLAPKSSVSIVDYGCGLAHRSLAVSRRLMACGVKVKLTLVDIRKEWHAQFLEFLMKKYGVDYEFIEITADRLYPELPPHDFCDNVSVLEHIREPLTVVNHTHAALRPGGLFLAYVSDSIEEMMHLSVDLRDVRARLQALGYVKLCEVHSVPLFQKPLS
jgi:SAM-dependent methyltransferase